MTKRFTAQDARYSVVVPSHDYDSVIESIKQRCSIGESYLYWYRAVDLGTKKLLEQDGFTVKITCDQREGDSTKITW